MHEIFVRKLVNHFYFAPYSPLVAQGGVSFPHVFLDSKPAHKKLWNLTSLTKMQYYYIGYETRGGVDVKPPERIFEKRVFGDCVPKHQKTRFLGGAFFGFFGKPRLRRCVIFYFFFSRFCFLKSRVQISISPRVLKMSKNVIFDPFFPEFSGNFPGIFRKFFPENFFSGNLGKFSRNFPRFSDKFFFFGKFL